MSIWLRRFGVSLTLSLLVAVASRAGDHFLTIGGGYAPSGNQVSLEKNVLFFQHLLDQLQLRSVPHDIFFSDGDSPQRDLQYVDPAIGTPRSNLLMARIFGREDDLEVQFRSHQVPGIHGGANTENLDRWFDDVGTRLKDGDRLVVYLTGHGGKGTDAQNPHFFLWNRQQVPVKEFVGRLDKIDPNVQVVLVMVQCYSGGFANCIFNEGDSSKGVTKANRCGFYATVHNRPAAGCTPDIDEENYQEYSSSFWAAICGESRTGDTVEQPDLDDDGTISFAEAHAYTVLHSNTIDIPVKTSDAFLRALSKTSEKGRNDLLTADAPYEKLLAAAPPIDRAVLDGLSATLELSSSTRAKQAREQAAEIDAQRKRLTQDRKKLQGKYQRVRQSIADALKYRWPEFGNPWHPKVAEELRSEGDAIVSAIEADGRYSEFNRLHDEIEERSKQLLDLERRWVKCQRFLHLAESIALAANLTKVASSEAQDRYARLVECESASLCEGTADTIK